MRSYTFGIALVLRLIAVGATLACLTAGCVDKPTEHRVRANAYLRGGDANKALEEIDVGLGKSKDDLPLHILRGKALFELERYDDSKNAYLRAVEIGADRPKEIGEAQLGLAIIAMRNKDLPEARKRFSTMVEQNAKDHDARINLARVCLQMEDLPCALEHGEEVGRHRGRSEEVLFTLGRIYVAAKKYDDANKTFAHICEVVPNAASCPYGLALVFAQQSKPDEAIAKLKEAIGLKLPNPEKLADDPMLAPLKDKPAFVKLVADAKGS